MKRLMIVSSVAILMFGVCAGSTFAAPDLSNPKSAAMAFAKAMEAGDADVAKAATLSDANNQELVTTLAGMVANVNKLRDSAKAKFGDAAGEQIAGNMKSMDMAKQLEDAEVKETGDTASISSTKTPGNPVQLKKVDGEWKVDMASSIAAAPGGGNIAQQLPFLKAVGAAMGELSTEITAGKYKDVEEAQSAMQTKMMGAMAAMRRPATSAPATQPGN